MDVISAKEMITREKAAFASGITPTALMTAAGEAMAERILQNYPHAKAYLVLVGKGNNGGDGIVIARHLLSMGKSVRVVLAAPEKDLGELPIAQLQQLRTRHPQADILPWDGKIDVPGMQTVVIDALLGIQAKGALREPVAEIVAKLNEARTRYFFRTVALDLPSGLAAYDDAKVPEDKNAAVIADLTLAVGFAKDVLVREDLSAWVGRLEVIPWSNEPATKAPRQVLVPQELAHLLPRRSAFSYKGDYGKLAIVAGSVGFTGAPVLCAQAALAMGTGLLSVVTHKDAAPIVAAHAPPEAMVSGWADLKKVPEVLRKASAIVIGPGLGLSADSLKNTLKMVRAVLELGVPTVLDADGLTALTILSYKNRDILRDFKTPLIFTPHTGEMATLIGRKFKSTERESVARKFADRHKVTVLLKGTRTIVTAPGEPLHINTTGNPGLSTGGSGDTLSGIIGALLAQKLAPIDAARLGAWLHGHAADLALAERGCEEGLTPTLLSANLGNALVSLRANATQEKGLIESSVL